MPYRLTTTPPRFTTGIEMPQYFAFNIPYRTTYMSSMTGTAVSQVFILFNS